ncbi:MAG: glycosyltransferase family 2 protein [Myxococcota bacterium]|nr:glycosyltransferase family 2 protein [Myxococcota bacterium]MEC8382160.1 glycosyltransferase family 2 protein [Myxococcota bacterium]
MNALTVWWEQPWLSDLFLGSYWGLMVCVWLLMLLGITRWGGRWRIHHPLDAPIREDSPWVSICIPARNESLNIGSCVQHALNSRWPRIEVVVVDDRSTDGTRAAALEAAQGNPNLRLVEGTEPPTGWAGKPWACVRASKEARGAYLLFIDADVCIHPEAVQTAVRIAEERNLGLVSFFGSWTLVGFWERALIPVVGWLIRGAIDLDKVNSRGSALAFGNGQFMLFERAAYAAVEGHKAVFNHVLDDVRMAEALNRAGFATEIRPAFWAFQVRLYRSLREIINGYTKNLFEGMGRKPLAGLAAAAFIFIGTILPFVVVVGGVIGRLFLDWGVPSNFWLTAFVLLCGIQLAFRARLERFDGRSGALFWMHPIANVLLMWILLRSTFGVRTQWKGRTFVDGRAET